MSILEQTLVVIPTASVLVNPEQPRRDHLSWAKHYYLKSDVVKLKFVSGKGNRELFPSRFTPAADAWILKARDELGMTFLHIGRTMKAGREKVGVAGGRTNPVISHRYKMLKLEKQNKVRK